MKTCKTEDGRSCSMGGYTQAWAGHVWKVTNERHLHETNVSISLEFREGFIVLLDCLLLGQQSAKHPSIHHVTL